MSPLAAFSSAHGAAAVRHKSNAECKPVCVHPIDLVHLSKQSLGDRSMEREILKLFHSQSSLYLDRMANATTRSERQMAAHTIIGSARGIGAWKLADCAKLHSDGYDGDADLGDIRKAVDEVNAYIVLLLED